MNSDLQLLNNLPDDALLPAHWVRKLLGGQPVVSPANTATTDLTVEQVAAHFGRSPATIRRWLSLGKLEGAWKLSREWRIPASAIDNLRERNTSGKQRESARVIVSRKKRDDLGSWRDVYDEEKGGAGAPPSLREKSTPPANNRGSP